MRPIFAEASRGYSHLNSGTSKGSFTPFLQLKKFPDIPVPTREEARESRPHPEEPRFHLLAREQGSVPCVVGKEFPALPSYLKKRRSAQERPKKLQGGATIPRVPQMSQSIPGKPVFPALPRLSSRVSTHTTVERGTALWESLVRKPRGKASRESHSSLDQREGKRDTAATVREESARACPHSRRGLTPLGRPQKYSKVHVSTGEESSGSGTDSTQGLRPRHRRERNLKRRRSPQERREELQGGATIPRVPQMSQSISGKPVFPALPSLSSQGSITPR